MKILKVRSDHGGEFENESFKNFCEKHGIILEFSFHRTPQSIFNEMAKTTIHATNMAKYFWAKVVNTSCYVKNRIYIGPVLEKKNTI